jgi:putative hydrolase of the HAD superfamily
MIKAVVFDVGGVLSRFGARGEHMVRIANTLGCDTRLAGTQLRGLDIDWMSGKIPTSEFWKTAADLVNAPYADYETKWITTEPRNFELDYYDFAESLRREGYITAIFSNVNPTSETLIRNAGGYRGFHPVVLSPEIGACKPAPAAYRALLQILQLPAEQVLLIDDLAENLRAAEPFGIWTVQAYDPHTTQKRVLIELVQAQNTQEARTRRTP